MAMRYIVTIREVGQEKQVKGSEWARSADGEGYAYTPEIETMVDVDRTIYSQQFDTAYVSAIVKAANGID